MKRPIINRQSKLMADERKQAEEALQKSEDLFKTLFEKSNDPILLMDENVYIACNDAVLTCLGYDKKEQIIGKKPNDISPLYQPDGENSETKALRILKETLERGHHRFEWVHLDCNNNEIWVDITLTYILYKGKKRLYAIWRNITQRKNAENALKQSEERYKRLVEGSPDIVYIFSSTRGALYWSPRVQTVLGYSPTNLIEKSFIWYNSIHPDDLPKVDLAIAESGRGKVFDLEYRIQDIHGNWHWFHDRCISNRKLGDEIIIEGLATDITERKQIQEALRESETRFRTISELVSDYAYVLWVDPNGRLAREWVTDACTRITGYEPEEIDACGGWMSLVHPDDQETVFRHRHTFLSGEENVCEYRIISKSGDIYWLRDYSRPIWDETKGHFVRVFGAAQDITEYKRAAAEIETNARRLQTIIETVEEGITLRDESGYFEIFNSKMEEITGYTREEANNSDDFLTLLYPDPQKYQQAVLGIPEIQRLGGYHDVETTIRAKDGMQKTLLVSTSIMQYQNRKWFLSAYHDITWRKRVEEEVLLLKNAIDTSKIGVTITDAERKILYMNPAEASMHGYTSTELIGKDARIFSPEGYWKDIEFNKLEDGWARESVNIRKDGTTFPVNSISTPVRNEAGTPIGIITVSEDITKRKQVEMELHQAKENAEEAQRAAESANRAKSEFLANMSHELRTPLNAIIGFSQLLNRHPNLDPEQQRYLSIINGSGEHLLTLINQVLNLSKIEAGRMTLNERNFDLYRLLDDVEELFRTRAKRKSLELRFDRAQDVPQYVRTDEVKLRQVLINLLGNAMKFTKEGGVSVRVARYAVRGTSSEEQAPRATCATRNPEPATRLHFAIEDTGPGIAQEELQNLFEAFRQATTGRETQEGTGLGLTISRKFVQLMGGDMTIKSELECGTSVTFDIQVSVLNSIAIETRRPARHVVALEPDQPRYRILIVDDNRDNRQLFLNLLSPPGFEVREAESGQEAIEVWKTWQPHFIWMDLRMPAMDGYETTKKIRKAEEQKSRRAEEQKAVSSLPYPVPRTPHPIPHTIIIALTASPLEHERIAALSTGCDDFLAKPFRQTDIFDLMQKYLGVQYVYEERSKVAGHRSQVTGRRSQVAGKEVLMPEALAVLSPGLLTNLEQAALRSDVEHIDQVIQEIRTHNAPLADALARLADNFAYGEMLKLIRSTT